MKAVQLGKLILLETAGHICNFFKKLQIEAIPTVDINPKEMELLS